MMNTQEIGLFEVKTHLSKLIERVLAGESFCITRRGKPVAHLSPAKVKGPPIKYGEAKNPGYWMADDFDEPLEEMKEYME